MFQDAPIESVKGYWNRRPCNIRHSPKPVGTREYFDEVEARKYFVEPHIPRFAEFECWKGKKVLYCYVSDCVDGIYRLMQSDFRDPINLGQDRLITVNELVDIVARIAGKQITKRYDVTKPQGVRGRNADLTLMKKALGWEPRVSLEEGLEKTYHWIAQQLRKEGRLPG